MTVQELIDHLSSDNKEYLNSEIYFMDLFSGREFKPELFFLFGPDPSQNKVLFLSRFEHPTEEEKLIGINSRLALCGEPEIKYEVIINKF